MTEIEILSNIKESPLYQITLNHEQIHRKIAKLFNFKTKITLIHSIKKHNDKIDHYVYGTTEVDFSNLFIIPKNFPKLFLWLLIDNIFEFIDYFARMNRKFAIFSIFKEFIRWSILYFIKYMFSSMNFTMER